MRHKVRSSNFGRNSSHRSAMFKNLCISLFEHGVIKTTLPKAKELRRVVEPLITLAKVDSVANRRLAFRRLGNKDAVKALFETYGKTFKDRDGGYTRVLKCGFRKGDSAPMAFIELIKEETQAEVPKKKAAKKKTETKKPVTVEAEAVEVIEEKVETKAETAKEDKKEGKEEK